MFELPRYHLLNPRDYSIWSILEAKACSKPHKNIESLKHALLKAWDEILIETLAKIVDKFPTRLENCIEVKGDHFEIKFCCSFYWLLLVFVLINFIFDWLDEGGHVISSYLVYTVIKSIFLAWPGLVIGIWHLFTHSTFISILQKRLDYLSLSTKAWNFFSF